MKKPHRDDEKPGDALGSAKPPKAATAKASASKNDQQDTTTSILQQEKAASLISPRITAIRGKGKLKGATCVIPSSGGVSLPDSQEAEEGVSTNKAPATTTRGLRQPRVDLETKHQIDSGRKHAPTPGAAHSPVVPKGLASNVASRRGLRSKPKKTAAPGPKMMPTEDMEPSRGPNEAVSVDDSARSTDLFQQFEDFHQEESLKAKVRQEDALLPTSTQATGFQMGSNVRQGAHSVDLFQQFEDFHQEESLKVKVRQEDALLPTSSQTPGFQAVSNVRQEDPLLPVQEFSDVREEEALVVPSISRTPPDTTGLAVASLVQDEPSIRMLPNAQEVDLEQQRELVQKQRRKTFRTITIAVAGLLLLVVGIVLLVVYVVIRPNDTNKNTEAFTPTTPTPSSSPTQAPTMFSFFVQSLLPSFSQDAIYSNPNSPQARALEWVVNDPNFTSYQEWRVLQRFALATIFYATEGETWYNATHWLSYNVSECEWFSPSSSSFFCLGGINGSPIQQTQCSLSFGWEDYPLYEGDTGRFQSLSLPSSGLKGSLPAEVGLLTSLRIFDLSNNKLKGSIPSSIGELTSLQDVRLNANMLDSIPSELGLLSNMTQLNLGNNQINSLPNMMGQWTALKHLYMEENNIGGSLPSELGLMTSLDKLHLFRNKLSILSIPTEMGQMTLRELLLAENNLPATIPSELGLLQSLTSLDIIGTRGIDSSYSYFEGFYEYEYGDGGHKWSGTIPTELGLLQSLQSLRLDRGYLTGTIPSELGSMSSLWHFLLRDNMLQGQIPSELGGLNVEQLDLSLNQLTAGLPSEFGSIFELQILAVSSNQISGPLPSDLGRLSGMLTMMVSGITACSEAYRRKLDSCTYGKACGGVQAMYFDSNLFTGQIPSEFGALNLQTLNLSLNDQLTGTLPQNFCLIDDGTSLLYDCSLELCGCACNCSNGSWMGPTTAAPEPVTNMEPFIPSEGTTQIIVEPQLEFGFLDGIQIREPSTEELAGLMDQTSLFYTELLEKVYSNLEWCEAVLVGNETNTADTDWPIKVNFDVHAFFTNDTTIPTVDEVVAVFESANYYESKCTRVHCPSCFGGWNLQLHGGAAILSYFIPLFSSTTWYLDFTVNFLWESLSIFNIFSDPANVKYSRGNPASSRNNILA